jgi:hypothetical protein
MERRISQLLDVLERMPGRVPLHVLHVGEQGAASLILASHHRSCDSLIITRLAWLFIELLVQAHYAHACEACEAWIWCIRN